MRGRDEGKRPRLPQRGEVDALEGDEERKSQSEAGPVNMSTARGGLLAIQTKRAESLSLGPVSTYARLTYADRGEKTVQDAIEDLEEVERLRAEIIANSNIFEKQVEQLIKYYGMLSAMELRFPISKDPSHINSLSFVWWDAFKPSKKEKQQNINFEKCAVLFNLAALYSQNAIDQERTTSPGLVVACKKFQEAAGVFSYIKEHLSMRTDAPHPLDISPDSTKMLEQLMLAQAQECVFEKAMVEGKSEGVCARLGKQCGLFYTEVISIIAGSALNSHMDKSWLNHLRSKVNYFAAESEMLMAEAEKKKDETNIGPQIARLRFADLKIKEGEKSAKAANAFIAEASKNLSELCSKLLRKAVKDNETIYLETVPPHESVPAISEACMVKAAQPTNLNKMSGDVFVGLVPDSSAKVVSKYTELVDDLINKEKNRLMGSQDALGSKMKALNLPDLLVALDQTNSQLISTILSDELRERIAEVNSYGGVKHYFELARELQGLRTVGTQMLNGAEEELDNEASEDAKEREANKEKWVIPPSESLTGSLRASIAEFRSKIQTAERSDKSTLEQLEHPANPITLLESETLGARTPFLAKPMVSVGAGDADTVAADLKLCLEEADACSAQMISIEEQLNEMKFKDNILPVLMASSDSEEKIFNEQLQKYKPLQSSVGEACALQGRITTKLGQKHADFVSVFDIGDWKSQCAQFASQVQGAYDMYKQIQINFEKGIGFYTSLQDAIHQLKQQCSDFCLTRKMQRDDFVRQLAFSKQQQEQQAASAAAAAALHQQQQQQQQQQQHYQSYPSAPAPQYPGQGYPPHHAPTYPSGPPPPQYPSVQSGSGYPGAQSGYGQQGWGADQAAQQMSQMHMAPPPPGHQQQPGYPSYPPPPQAYPSYPPPPPQG